MGYIIARNAGKRATFESLMMNLNSEWVARIECKLDDDPRLIAGAAAIVEDLAHRSGLSDRAAGEIAAAAAQGCSRAFLACKESGVQQAAIKMTAAESPDRVEVIIDILPEGGGEGSERPRPGNAAECVEKIRKALETAALDSVTVELRDGRPSVTLIKNGGAAKRRFAF